MTPQRAEDAGGAYRPPYIELCGVAGVGKSTLARLLRQSFPHRIFHARDRRQESALRLIAEPRAPVDRAKAFWRLFRYLLIDRRAFGLTAMRRARYIVGVPARRDWLGSRENVMLLDEGPLTYLVTLGGYGAGWEEMTEILVPDRRAVHPIYIFLAGGPTVVDARVARRARPHKLRFGRTGKEGITREHRMDGLAFWYDRLREAGVNCLWVETDDLSPEEVHEKVSTYLVRLRPDLAAFGTEGRRQMTAGPAD